MVLRILREQSFILSIGMIVGVAMGVLTYFLARTDMLTPRVGIDIRNIGRNMGELSEKIDVLYEYVSELRSKLEMLDTLNKQVEGLTEIPEESVIASRVVSIEKHLLEVREALDELYASADEQSQVAMYGADFQERMQRIEERVLKNPGDALSVRLLEERMINLEGDVARRAYGDTVGAMQGSLSLLGNLVAVTMGAIVVLMSFMVAVIRSAQGRQAGQQK